MNTAQIGDKNKTSIDRECKDLSGKEEFSQMIHSAAAIQIPQIIISEDREIDFVIPSRKISAESDDDDVSVVFFDDEIDDDGSSAPVRRYLRADNAR